MCFIYFYLQCLHGFHDTIRSSQPTILQTLWPPSPSLQTIFYIVAATIGYHLIRPPSDWFAPSLLPGCVSAACCWRSSILRRHRECQGSRIHRTTQASPESSKLPEANQADEKTLIHSHTDNFQERKNLIDYELNYEKCPYCWLYVNSQITRINIRHTFPAKVHVFRLSESCLTLCLGPKHRGFSLQGLVAPTQLLEEVVDLWKTNPKNKIEES